MPSKLCGLSFLCFAFGLDCLCFFVSLEQNQRPVAQCSVLLDKNLRVTHKPNVPKSSLAAACMLNALNALNIGVGVGVAVAVAVAVNVGSVQALSIFTN